MKLSTDCASACSEFKVLAPSRRSTVYPSASRLPFVGRKVVTVDEEQVSNKGKASLKAGTDLYSDRYRSCIVTN